MEEISPKQWIIAIILTGLIAFGVGNLAGVKNTEKKANTNSSNVSQELSIQENKPLNKEAEEKLITVYVTGEVNNPDVYTVPEGSIVKDALEKAGGAKEDADLIAITLARKISDGEEIIVPKKGETIASNGDGSSSDTSNNKININTADAATLEKLPGIGEVKAGAIIQYRKSHGMFKTVHDITRVSGIGEKTFEKIEELITVG